MKFLKYSISNVLYQRQISVTVDRLCNGFSAKNAGNTIVLLNGEPLQPGESKSVGGNYAEVFVGRIDVAFAMPDPAPGTPVNACYVTQKTYETASEFDSPTF
jgi:hypothetical protein